MSDGTHGFGDEMEPRRFRIACEEYARWATTEYDTFSDVDFGSITVQVSEDLKKTAGKAGKAKSNIPTDYFMRFAYEAYENWGWDKQIEGVIRHELVHIVQYQERGTGGHGSDFIRMANEVNCSRYCEKFTGYNYEIRCSECDEVVAGRYRECKMTKKPGRYQSKCCEAKCYSEVV